MSILTDGMESAKADRGSFYQYLLVELVGTVQKWPLKKESKSFKFKANTNPLNNKTNDKIVKYSNTSNRKFKSINHTAYSYRK